MTTYNQDALKVLSGGIMDMDHNSVHAAIDKAIQPYTQRLKIVKIHPNGIASMQTVDDHGHVCMEWHGTITSTCGCGNKMDAYSAAGKQYHICPTCAAKIPDNDDICSILGLDLKSDN